MRANWITSIAAPSCTVEWPGQLGHVPARLVKDVDVQGSNTAAAKTAQTVGTFFGCVQDLARFPVDIELFLNLQKKMLNANYVQCVYE